MKKNTDPLYPERLYHIYNRGINSSNLFQEERNYPYFLSKFQKFVSPVVDLYAYCLLKNHFHLLIRVKTEKEIRNHFEQKIKNADEMPIEALISKGFNSLFKSYSVTINNTYKRTGRLFEEPYLRIPVTSNAQITRLILYIHTNAQKHGFVEDFRNYPHSSYAEHLSDAPTWLVRKEVIDWFGSKAEFIEAHAAYKEDKLSRRFFSFDTVG